MDLDVFLIIILSMFLNLIIITDLINKIKWGDDMDYKSMLLKLIYHILDKVPCNLCPAYQKCQGRLSDGDCEDKILDELKDEWN